MSYRGRDLDLYTSEQVRTGRTAGRQGARGPAFQRGNSDSYSSTDLDAGPTEDTGMLVDDAVLAVFNHAYDLAVAHRSSEVRLEHLLNAMTRTDAAVAVMSAMGIDVAGLRYDTASAIAAQEAMITGNERNSPRRSQDLADTLQFAAERASARRASVSIADILHTLFELNRERPGLDMLKRNAAGWQPRQFEPLPPLLGGYQSEPRFAAQPAVPPRDYPRVPQSSYFTPQTPAAALPPGGTFADVVQNSRLDQLERTIRELSGELTAERQAFSQLVTDLKRDVFSNNDTAMRMRGGLDDRLAGIEQTMMDLRNDGTGAGPQSADRLASIERSVESKFGDLARGWTVLGDRLQALEAAVSADRQQQVPAGLMERLHVLDDFSRVMTSFGERMSSLEREVASRPQPQAAAMVDLQPVLDRLAAIEDAQHDRASALTVMMAPVMEKLTLIETAASEPASAALSPMLEHLNMIDSRVAEVGRDAASAAERIERFERKMDSAADRLTPIEDEIAAQHDQLAQLATNLASDVKAIGQALTVQAQENERTHAVLTSALERQRSELAASIAGTLGDRLARVEQLVDTHRNDLGAQIAGIDKQVDGFGRRTIDLHDAHGKDIVELHDEIVKLNTNQHTLASSLDQWRLDIGGKLEGIDRGNSKSVQMLENLHTSMLLLQSSIVKREERRSRWQHWLMGTDDWYAASWEKPRQATGSGTLNRVDQPRNAAGPQPAKPVGPLRG